MGLSVEKNDDYDTFCTMFNVIETPGSSSAIIAFVFMTMLLPMFFNKHYNMVLITVLFILYFSDAFYRAIKYKCYGSLSIITTILSTVIGLSFGALYFFAIYFLGEDYYNLLYFNVSKNNRVQCDKLNTREYNCEWVDENGKTVEEQVESVSTTVADAAAEAATAAIKDALNDANSGNEDENQNENL